MVMDFEFRKQVMDYHQGSEVIKYCYQCNRCTDNCPVSYLTDEFYTVKYDPRENILNSLLGYKDNIFESDPLTIWGCTVCDTCDEVCPQSIELTEVFTFLKNESIKKGTAPDFFYQQAKMVYDHGKAIPMQSAIERRRQGMGLPDIQEADVDELKNLMNNMGVNNYLKEE